MQIHTTIDLEQLLGAAKLTPGTSIYLGQPSPELREFSYGDLMLVGNELHEAALRGLNIPRPLITEV